jgi:hypothetical protein
MANPDVAADEYYGQNPLKHYQDFGQREGRSWGAVAQPAGAPASSAQTMQQAFDKFRATPGYQFGFNQGQTALTSAANASGGLFSGKAGKALVKFGTDYADQQGYTPYMNRLASAAGLGQTATNQVGQYGQSTANNVGNALMSAGNARASGITGSANSWGNAIGQGAGLFGYMYGKGWGGV